MAAGDVGPHAQWERREPRVVGVDSWMCRAAIAIVRGAELILLIGLPVPACYLEVGASCHGFLMLMSDGVFRLDTRPRTVRPLEAGSKLMGVARYSPAPGSLSRELQFPKIPYSLVR